MIKVGDSLPGATLMEYSEVEGNGCSIGPNPVDVAKATAGKTIALFALPGAFTPTCSAKHVPGYVEKFNELQAAGVDEIWCVSVNDAFVMGAWAREQKTAGKVRMLGDGSADFSKAWVCAATATPCSSRTARSPLSMSKAQANSRSATRPPCWLRPRAESSPRSGTKPPEGRLFHGWKTPSRPPLGRAAIDPPQDHRSTLR